MMNARPDPGFYGTILETYWVSLDTGRIWCIQSPDLGSAFWKQKKNVRVCECQSLPKWAEPLSQIACDDIVIPLEITIVDEELGPIDGYVRTDEV